MKKNDIKMETLEDVFKSISTTGKATTVGSLLGRANKIRKEEQKALALVGSLLGRANKIRKEEQKALALQQKKEEEKMQWETLKEDVLSNKKEIVVDRVVLATLIKKIDSLEKTVEDLRLSDSIYHMPLR